MCCTPHVSDEIWLKDGELRPALIYRTGDISVLSWCCEGGRLRLSGATQSTKVDQRQPRPSRHPFAVSRGIPLASQQLFVVLFPSRARNHGTHFSGTRNQKWIETKKHRLDPVRHYNTRAVRIHPLYLLHCYSQRVSGSSRKSDHNGINRPHRKTLSWYRRPKPRPPPQRAFQNAREE